MVLTRSVRANARTDMGVADRRPAADHGAIVTAIEIPAEEGVIHGTTFCRVRPICDVSIRIP